MKVVAILMLMTTLVTLTGCETYLSLTHSGAVETNPGKRSLGAIIDDSSIESIVAVNIRKSIPELAKANISVVSYNGIVLLTGQVESEALKSAAGVEADKVVNVRKVYNELEVKGSRSHFAGLNDAWLTTKIKSKMLFNKSIETNRIKVVTENGVVYLMGLVTHEEGNRVVDLVRNSYGVQRIVKVFEYIN